MKKLYNLTIPFLFIIVTANINGQEWIWSRHFNTSNPSIITGLELDGNNNIYVSGQFKASIAISPDSSLTPLGNTNLFLIKYDYDNNFIWNIHLASLVSNAKINAKNVVFDPSGYAVFCGFYNQDLINQGDGYTLPIKVGGKRAALLGKYSSSDGTRTWLKAAAWGPDDVKAQYLTIDPDGNIYLTGFSNDNIYFDSDTIYTSGGQIHNFIAKYDSDGNFIWVTQITSSTTDANQNKFIEIEAATANEIYLAGFFKGTLQTGSITLNSVTSTFEDAVLLKFDDSGNALWARQIGGASDDRINGVKSDIYSNIYITGYINGSANFDSTGNGLLDSSPLLSKGAEDMIVARYNKNGRLIWKKANGDTKEDKGYGAYIHENIVQFAGSFAGTVSFNETVISSGSVDNQDAGFFVYDIDGNAITAQSIQGDDNNDRSEQITYDNKGNTYIGGYFTSTHLTIGDSTYTNGIIGDNNGYIAKYHTPFSITFSTIEQILCNGDNNGQLIVTPYFGVGPYTYDWSHDAGLNDSTASNLSAGAYSVTITDSRDSIAFTSTILNEPSPITITPVITDVSCHPTNGASNNGSIAITAGGGTGPGTYSYAWEAISGSGINPTSEDQTGLTMGQYSVTVTDDNLCVEDDTFLIVQPDPIIFAGSVTPSSESGSDGAIDINPSGGTSPYSYLWSPGGQTTQDLNSIPGGEYAVAITDNNLCEGDTNYVVSEGDLLFAHIFSKTDVDCKGNSTGSAIATALGGIRPFTYDWSHDPGLEDSVAVNLAFGLYRVTITDAIDSTSETEVYINEPEYELSSTIVGTDLVCFRDYSGTANLSVSGGTLPYAYSWSNGTTTEDLIHVAASNYYVTVTDKNGCQIIDGVTLDEPPAMDINITTDQPIFCHGDLTGILTATATGGTGIKMYVWDDPGNQTAKTATNLGGGLYHVTATDQVGCTVTDSRQLIEPAAISIIPNAQDISCYGSDDGIISLTVSGGTPSFNFTWSNGAIDQNIQNLSAGSYRVTVTDLYNCSDTASTTINEPGEIFYQSVTISDASCFGYSDGTISISGAGGSGSLEYSTDGGSSYTASGIFADLTAQSYTLKIRDANDCESSDSIVAISQPEGITISSEESSNITCNGEQDGSIVIVASSAVGGLTYSIDDGQTFLDNSGIFSGLSASDYQVRVMESGGCEQPGSAITVVEPLPVALVVTVANATGAQPGSAEMVASGGTSPYLYILLSESDSSSNDNGTFDNLLPGNYDGFAIDVNLCESENIVIAIEQGSTVINIYDAFSPNGDGINDLWNIANIGLYPNCKVTIFNTWGNIVFRSDGYAAPWDGKYSSKDLPAGTYYYTIDPGDGSEILTGPVSIVR